MAPRGKGSKQSRSGPPPIAALILQQQRMALEATVASNDRVASFLASVPRDERPALFKLSVDELRKEARRLSEQETRDLQRQLASAGPSSSKSSAPSMDGPASSRGGYPALVDRVLGLHVSRGTWKIFSWPGEAEEFSDRTAFHRWARRTRLADSEDLLALLEEDDGASPPPEDLSKLVLQLAEDLRRVSLAIDALDANAALLGGLAGGKGGRVQLGSSAALQQYRTLCIEGVATLCRSLLQAPEALQQWFLRPIDAYVDAIVQDAGLGGPGDAAPPESPPRPFTFQDLGKLTLMELYQLFGWLEARVESLKERLEGEGRARAEGAGGEDPAPAAPPVEVLEISPDGTTVGLSRSWLGLLQGTEEGPDGKMVETADKPSPPPPTAKGPPPPKGKKGEANTTAAAAADPGLGVLLDFLSGSVVHTAERIRESAHAPLGSQRPSVLAVAELLSEGLYRAGQIRDQAETAADVERKLSALVAEGGAAGDQLSGMVERELLLASAKVHIIVGELKELESRLRALKLEVSYEEHLASRGEDRGKRDAAPRPTPRLDAVTEELELVEQTIRRREEARSELFAQQGRMLRKLSDVILGKSGAPAAAAAASPSAKEPAEGAVAVLQRVVGIEHTPEEAAGSVLKQLSAYVRRQRSVLALHTACLRQLELHLSDLACVDYGSVLGQKVVLPLLNAKLHQLAEAFHERQAEERMKELLKEEGASKAAKKKAQAAAAAAAAAAAKAKGTARTSAVAAAKDARTEGGEGATSIAGAAAASPSSSSSDDDGDDNEKEDEKTDVTEPPAPEASATAAAVNAEEPHEDDATDFQVVSAQKKKPLAVAAAADPGASSTQPAGTPTEKKAAPEERDKDRAAPARGAGSDAKRKGPTGAGKKEPGKGDTATASSTAPPRPSTAHPIQQQQQQLKQTPRMKPSERTAPASAPPPAPPPGDIATPPLQPTPAPSSSPSFELSSLNISLLSQLSAIAVGLGADLGQLLGSPLLSGAGLSGLLQVSPEQISNALQVLSGQIADRHAALQSHAAQLQDQAARMQHEAAQLQSQLHALHTDVAYIQSILAVQRTQRSAAAAQAPDALCILCKAAPRTGGFVHADGGAHVRLCAACVRSVEEGGSGRCPACGDVYVACFGRMG